MIILFVLVRQILGGGGGGGGGGDVHPPPFPIPTPMYKALFVQEFLPGFNLLPVAN